MRVAVLLLATAMALPAATTAGVGGDVKPSTTATGASHAYTDEVTGHDITMLVLTAERGVPDHDRLRGAGAYVLADFGRR